MKPICHSNPSTYITKQDTVSKQGMLVGKKWQISKEFMLRLWLVMKGLPGGSLSLAHVCEWVHGRVLAGPASPDKPQVACEL